MAHFVDAAQVSYHPVYAWPIGQCLFHYFSYAVARFAFQLERCLPGVAIDLQSYYFFECGVNLLLIKFVGFGVLADKCRDIYREQRKHDDSADRKDTSEYLAGHSDGIDVTPEGRGVHAGPP